MFYDSDDFDFDPFDPGLDEDLDLEEMLSDEEYEAYRNGLTLSEIVGDRS